MRIGHGYDVHRFAENRKLILGGVEIPFEYGLLGHSDADVLLHAISDALLGAAALGDIGKLFPDTDDRFLGADSLLLLAEVVRVLEENGYKIVNIDSTDRDRPEAKAARLHRYHAPEYRRRVQNRRLSGQRQGDHRREARLYRQIGGHFSPLGLPY